MQDAIKWLGDDNPDGNNKRHGKRKEERKHPCRKKVSKLKSEEGTSLRHYQRDANHVERRTKERNKSLVRETSKLHASHEMMARQRLRQVSLWKM